MKAFLILLVVTSVFPVLWIAIGFVLVIVVIPLALCGWLSSLTQPRVLPEPPYPLPPELEPQPHVELEPIFLESLY